MFASSTYQVPLCHMAGGVTILADDTEYRNSISQYHLKCDLTVLLLRFVPVQIL